MGRTFRKRRRRTKKLSNVISGPIVPESLITWSLSNGLKMSDMTPKMFYDCGRGLKTTSDIQPPHIVITVPLGIMITFDNVCRCPLVKNFMSHGTLKAKDAFMLYLLIERWKGRHSFYFHYIDNLPPTYATPSYMPTAEARLLPPFLSNEVWKQKNIISDAFVRMSKTLKKCERKLLEFSVTKQDIRWAWNVINTRSVYFDTKHLGCRWDGDVSEVNFALLPILDLLNHKSTALIDVRFNDQARELQIITKDRYKRGDQVFINYGAHSNRALFCEYGFVLPDNVHNQITLSRDLLLKHTAGGLNKPQIDSISSALLRSGVSLDRMCLTLEGFDWSFVTAAHMFHSCTSEEQLQCNGFVVEQCVGSCGVTDILRIILLELIEQHIAVIRNIETKRNMSPILKCVVVLLNTEIDMMKENLVKITGECLL